MTDIFRRLLAMLKRNWVWKLLSLLFAILLWSFVILQTNPPLDKRFYNIPVQVQGQETLTARGFALSLQEYELPKTVSVHVQVSSKDYDALTSDKINAVVDLGKINQTGIQSLPVEIHLPSGVTLGSVSKNETVLLVETLVQNKSIPVEYKQSGMLGEDYWRGEPILTPKVLLISGPKSQVDRVVQAQVNYTVSGVMGTVMRSCPYTLLDAEGEAVESVDIHVDETSVMLELPIYKIRQVPVEITGNLVGKENLPDGFEFKGVVPAPNVKVAGPPEIIDTLEKIDIIPVDISPMPSGYTVMEATLNPPQGVILVDGDKLQISISIGPQTVTRTFTNRPIELSGLGAGLRATLTGVRQVNVVVMGTHEQLDPITAGRFTVKADLTGLAAGTHIVQLTVETSPDEDGYMPPWASLVKPEILSVEVAIAVR